MLTLFAAYQEPPGRTRLPAPSANRATAAFSCYTANRNNTTNATNPIPRRPTTSIICRPPVVAGEGVVGIDVGDNVGGGVGQKLSCTTLVKLTLLSEGGVTHASPKDLPQNHVVKIY